jgi:hypothetical protein
MEEMESARFHTSRLRTSDQPRYRRLREFLIARGIDPTTAAVADLFSDDVDQYFGVIVAPGGRVFTFVLQDVGPQVGGPSQEMEVREWRESSGPREHATYQDRIDAALAFMDEPTADL